MDATARLKNHPTSARKMRFVADTIRGLGVEKALNILKYTKNHNAKPLEKLILSGISNWEQANEGKGAENADLFIKQIFVDSGRSIKRFRPAPFGRAHRIRKRSNHVTVILSSRNESAEAEAPVETNEEAQS